MGEIKLKGLKFPNLESVYVVPNVDGSLTVDGAAADAKTVGDRFDDLNVYIVEDPNADGNVVMKNTVLSESDIKIDKSLTVEGAAADAKEVGDRFNDLNTIIATDENSDGCVELREFVFEEDFIEVDKTLTTEGAAADAKIVGDHVKNNNNPHNITIEQIGAAPGGLGWGSPSGGPTLSDLNQAVLPGFYNAGGYGTLNSPGGNMVYSPVFVQRRNDYIYQRMTNIDGYDNIVEAIRASKDGGVNWEPWEWVNPPMLPSVEYRTTERFNGKSVYKKLILVSVDTFNDYASSYSIPHGISGADIFLTPEVTWQDGGSLYWRNFPGAYYGDLNWCTQLIVDDTYMFFEIGQSAWPSLKSSKNPVHVTLKYTKK